MSSIHISSMASRSSRSKPLAPANKPPPPVEEEFDLNNVSDSSEDEDTLNPVPTKAAIRAGANVLDNERTHVAPIIKPVVKSNRAINVNLLFDCAKGQPSVCKYCK